MSLSIVHPRKQGHSGPSLFISILRPLPRLPRMNASFLSAPRMAGLGQGQTGRSTGLGAALGPLPGLLKGQLFRMWGVSFCPKLSPGHLTPTTSPPAPYHPGHPRPTLSQQHVVQGAQLPIGCRSSFLAIGRGPAPGPPSAPCGGTACRGFRRGGKVHCAAAPGGGGKSRARRRDPSGMFPSGPPGAGRHGEDWPRASDGGS